MSNTQALNIDTENKTLKREMPKELNLSVFQYPYSWNTWYGFWRNLRYFFRCWRPAWHRATKGFCRMDCWNVDQSMTSYMIKVLIEFRNCTCGWPDQYFTTFEEWIAYIDEIIDLLIFSLKDTDDDELCPHHTEWWEKCCQKKGDGEYSKEQIEIRDAYIAEVNAAYAKQKAARIKAFSMLGEHLDHIWW